MLAFVYSGGQNWQINISSLSFTLVEVVLLSGSVLLLLPCLFLLIECLSALAKSTSSSNTGQIMSNLAVLVPANNEGAGIAQTINSITVQLPVDSQLLVVADNCTDDTAEVARCAGANVIERNDPHLRGKGYALDFGVRYLANDPPDLVIMVDADCSLSPGTLSALAQQVHTQKCPCQAVYLMEKPQNPSTKDAVSTFAFRLKNQIRPLGLANLDQPCLLTGTGIALPWKIISQVDLANSHLVEDMKLGLDLSIIGYPPQLCPQAKVLSRLPQGEQAATTQRTRWEHGHIKVLLEYAPKLLSQFLKQRRLALLALCLEISIPPISLLVMVVLATLGFTSLWGWLTQSWLPLQITSLAATSVVIAVGLAWLHFGREDLTTRQLASVPFYILWKVPVYLKFLVKPQKDWMKTTRD